MNYACSHISTTFTYVYASQIRMGSNCKPITKKRVSTYTFGFNGMEMDNEVKGSGNSLDFGARIYDPRLGRWLSLDPLQKKYPSESPYIFVSNSVLLFGDKDGKVKILYVAFLPDGGNTQLTVEQKQEIIAKLQQTYDQHLIDVTVIGIEVTGKLDASQLDYTDNIVYIGNSNTLKEYLPDDYVSGISTHFSDQESYVDFEQHTPKYGNNVPTDEKRYEDYLKWKEEEGQSMDEEGWVSININHEVTHRHISGHTVGKEHMHLYDLDQAVYRIANKPNIMSPGQEQKDFGPAFPFKEATFNKHTNEAVEVLKAFYGAQKWYSNVTTKKEVYEKSGKDNFTGKTNVSGKIKNKITAP